MNTVINYRDGEAMPKQAVNARLSTLRASTVALLSNALLLLDARASLSGAALPTSFDQKMLTQRGIDPALATSLLQAPRFTAGKYPITLVVNGKPHGRVDVALITKVNCALTVPCSMPPTCWTRLTRSTAGAVSMPSAPGHKWPSNKTRQTSV